MSLERPENLTEMVVRYRTVPKLGKLASLLMTLLGVNIGRNARIGHGCQLPHGAVGLVIHDSTVIGDDVALFQGVTLGRGDQYWRLGVVDPDAESDAAGYIEIGDRVIIGANATVLFTTEQIRRIGADAIIGANSVVTRDVPAGEIWAGNPARFLRKNPRLAQ
jgi:serine O-acetyltransferase